MDHFSTSDSDNNKRRRRDSQEHAQNNIEQIRRHNRRFLRFTQREDTEYVYSSDNQLGFEVRFHKPSAICFVVDINDHPIPISTNGRIPSDFSESEIAILDSIQQSVSIYDLRQEGILLRSVIENIDGNPNLSGLLAPTNRSSQHHSLSPSDLSSLLSSEWNSMTSSTEITPHSAVLPTPRAERASLLPHKNQTHPRSYPFSPSERHLPSSFTEWLSMQDEDLVQVWQSLYRTSSSGSTADQYHLPQEIPLTVQSNERSEQTRPVELPQYIAGYRRESRISGRGMNCLIRAVLVSGGYDLTHRQFEAVVTAVRTSLVHAGFTGIDRMLNIGGESGLGAIAFMRSLQIGNQPLLDPRRGIDVYTLDPHTGQERVTPAVGGETGHQPYAIFLDDSTPGEEHFHALIPHDSSHLSSHTSEWETQNSSWNNLQETSPHYSWQTDDLLPQQSDHDSQLSSVKSFEKEFFANPLNNPEKALESSSDENALSTDEENAGKNHSSQKSRNLPRESMHNIQKDIIKTKDRKRDKQRITSTKSKWKKGALQGNKESGNAYNDLIAAENTEEELEVLKKYLKEHDKNRSYHIKEE